MPTFRKKPVKIQAFQWTPEAVSNSNSWPSWLYRASMLLPEADGAFVVEDNIHCHIKTLEGDMTVTLNDWIIQGVQGEIYPCKPDIFEETYEAVEYYDA